MIVDLISRQYKSLIDANSILVMRGLNDESGLLLGSEEEGSVRRDSVDSVVTVQVLVKSNLENGDRSLSIVIV